MSYTILLCFQALSSFHFQFRLDEKEAKMPGKTPSPPPRGKSRSPSPKQKSASPKNARSPAGGRTSPGKTPSPGRKKSPGRGDKSPSSGRRSGSAKGKTPSSAGNESSPASASRKKNVVIKTPELTERGLKVLDYSGQGMTVIPASLLSSKSSFNDLFVSYWCLMPPSTCTTTLKHHDSDSKHMVKSEKHLTVIFKTNSTKINHLC